MAMGNLSLPSFPRPGVGVGAAVEGTSSLRHIPEPPWQHPEASRPWGGANSIYLGSHTLASLESPQISLSAHDVSTDSTDKDTGMEEGEGLRKPCSLMSDSHGEGEGLPLALPTQREDDLASGS